MSGFDPTALPADLPVPHDDGAADHLAGAALPAVALTATDGAALAPYGTIATYGAPDGPLEVSLDLIAKNGRIDFVLVYTMPDEAKRAAVADITHALEEDALRPLPVQRFPLEQTQAAHEAVEGGFVGKVLIDVPQEPDPEDG